MTKLALIDADLVAFRCAATCNNEVFKIAVYRMEDMLDNIFRAIVAKEYKLYLSGKGNFRKKISPDYKANRKDRIPPTHLNDCREYLTSKWKAIVTDGIEADDALGIEQCLALRNENESTVICSIDKDLLQIPGRHYNFLHEVKSKVTPLDGLRHFYKQLLIGDSSDNVFGVAGIGKVKAGRLIDVLDSESEMFSCVRNLYGDDSRLLINCNLLWIQQAPNELWTHRSNKLLEDIDEATISKSEGKSTPELDEKLDSEADRLDPRRC